MKFGRVALVGRPNAGKSTLINNLIGTKVSIATPKPQTTRKIIQAIYADKQGKIVFIDTPGIFGKVQDQIGKRINLLPQTALAETDVVVYLIDRSRERGHEENKILGLVRKINRPKILVINKTDLKNPNYIHQYKFLEDEFDAVIEISALKKQHLKTLIEKIFSFLPEKGVPPEVKAAETPLLNLSPEEFVAEIIREKAFYNLRQEIPYSVGVSVELIEDREDLFYIKAKILTTQKRYQGMIVGHSGKKIKKIGTEARKEIEALVNKKVYLDLEVKTDPRWPERLA